MSGRKFVNTTPEHILQDVSSGEAIPAIDVLKRSIVESLLVISVKESELMRSKILNNGNASPTRKVDFGCSLVYAFNLIKGMVRAKGIYDRWDKLTPTNVKTDPPKSSDYGLMEELENGTDLTVAQLIGLKNYLLYCLHKLKLTNLLIEMEMDLDKAIAEDF